MATTSRDNDNNQHSKRVAEGSWKEALAGSSSSLIPSPRPITNGLNLLRTTTRHLRLARDDADGLDASSSYLVVAWALVIWRYSRNESVSFDVKQGQTTWPVQIAIQGSSRVQELFSQVVARLQILNQLSSASAMNTGPGLRHVGVINSILRIVHSVTDDLLTKHTTIEASSADTGMLLLGREQSPDDSEVR